MTPATLFLTVALAHLLAVASPGPDFAVVVRQTLARGRSAGIWTALGIASGILGHVAWAMFGLGWVVERYPLFLELLRYSGAGFLLWMGIGALRASPLTADPSHIPPPVPGRAARDFGIGLATNLLNPKALMFFVALCAAVITQDTPTWLRLGLGAWMVVSTATWFILLSITLGHPSLRRHLILKAHWIDRGMGIILIALAVGMLSGQRLMEWL